MNSRPYVLQASFATTIAVQPQTAVLIILNEYNLQQNKLCVHG